MASDQQQHVNPKEFYSEEMSPSELFAARSRSRRIPVRGQKDFFPDGSEEQRRRLEESLEEHWSLLEEERVERLGNLVRGTWKPEEQLVELQTPAGKFWQTMGFSSQGRQYLLPEEALYLMECGNVQVFQHDLPLSIQDCYESFLSGGGSVSLQQYQVFGHLKRLGYVVHRFEPSSEPSSYERQLNLPRSRDKAGLKRKRSGSPTSSTAPSTCSAPASCSAPSAAPACSQTEAVGETSTPQEMEVDQLRGGSPEPAEGDGVRTWWRPESPGNSRSASPPPTAASRWDFASIAFPDVGSSSSATECLASPDPALLPRGLTVQPCDVAPWRQRLNQRKVKMSAEERRRQDEESRRRTDVNADHEVRQCRNWAEYHQLLARRRVERPDRPAHLWNREVTPLLDPAENLSIAEVLEKISVIQPTDLLDGASRLEASDKWKICFNVYHPDSVADFKKSKPGKPHSRMCVCSFSDPVPDLRALKHLALQSGDVQVVVAVVDHGDISFYTFKDFHLPTDIFE
ncbi:unnamed protein product [Ophioblennius macclurei]